MTVSRRDLLSLMVSSSLAGNGCERTTPSFAGEVRGAAHPVGHKLIDAQLERSSGKADKVGVAIVGGGPAGLSAGWRLAKGGLQDYQIFDLERQVGGTSVFGTDAVVPYPWGAHYVPMPLPENQALVTLLAEMGLGSLDPSAPELERHRVREPEERLFYAGRWHEGLFPEGLASDRDLRELAKFERYVAQLVDFRDARGRRAFALPMRMCSDDSTLTALDKLSADSWLTRFGIRSKLVRWYLELACRDDYGMSLEQTSAWALLFYFCSRRATSSTPSQPFLAWPEGNGRLVEHLAKHSLGRLWTQSLVTDIVASPAGVELAVFDVKSEKLRKVVAEHAILAVPQFVARRLLRAWRDEPPAHVAQFTYGAWLVANLHLKSSPKSVGAAPAWDNVLFESPSLGYVRAGHQALRDTGPDVWTYYLPLTGPDELQDRRKLLELDHKTWSRAIVADLRRAHPDLDSLIERIDIYKWGHAMVRPTPGFVWGAARKAASNSSPPRVHFAHSDLSGVALFEEAQDRGVLAAENVLRALGRPVVPLAG